jgi:predicted HTH transcriptional regulator
MATKSANEPARGLREGLARVLEDPSRDKVRDLLKDHTGETANLDFKETWPAGEKLARHVLAMANSGGGCIVIGVKEQADKTLEPVGLTALKDKVDVTKKLNSLLPHSLIPNVHVDDFAYEASDYAALKGKKFQLVSVVTDARLLPFVVEKGTGDLRAAAIYVRRGTESVEANHEELQRIINQRLETGHSTAAAMKLDDHLDQLKVLQERIPRFKYESGYSAFSLFHTRMLEQMLGATVRQDNPDYPKEDMQAFILRVFDEKKNLIESELGLKR